ncbi:translation initiation factor 5 [Nematocida sp. AWRm80]|nr:translation initiation factor 5 [Nematocida sp. AWRm80]
MSLINIDHRLKDAFYRYKMPSIEVKIEGRGNGIKTVLVNIEEIARALKRDPRHITKYLSYEMGTLCSIDASNNKYIINGAHDKERVQEYIYNLIDALVLCKECTNPETVLYCPSSRKSVHQKCKACGYDRITDKNHKIMKTFLKELPDASEIEDDQEEEFIELEEDPFGN